MALFDSFASGKRHTSDYEDVSLLEMLGYKQELFRGLYGFMNFAVCITCVNSVACVIVLYGSGLTAGGPVVMVWGWLVVMVFTMFAGLSMAEISSSSGQLACTFLRLADPAAGSVYHWSGQLCSRKWAPIASYICGWFNFLGNTAGDATYAYSFASFVSGTLAAAAAPEGSFEMTFPVDSSSSTSSSSNGTASASAGGSGSGSSSVYVGLSTGETVAVAMAVNLVWALVNGLRVDRQGWVNSVSAVWQICSTIVVVVVLATMAPQANTAEFVFTEWNNETGWDNTGYVILLGLLYSLYSFSGYEAGAHLSEETKNAAHAAPRGIMWTCIITAFIGFSLTLVFCFTTINIDAILNNPYVGVGGANQPIIALFYYAAGSRGGLALAILMIVNLFFAGISSLTVTSRISFALARDGAFPGSTYIRTVSTANGNPIGTVIFVFIIDSIILLIALSPTSAFFNVTALCTIGFQVSYAIPILMRATTGRKTFKPNDFKLGPYSEAIAWVGGLWLITSSLILFWPSSSPVTVDSMNWAVVVVSIAVAIAVVWWIAVARHKFRGPPRIDDGTAFSMVFAEVSSASLVPNKLLDMFTSPTSASVSPSSTDGLSATSEKATQ